MAGYRSGICMVVAGALSVAGCAQRQIQVGQRTMREVIVELYEEEVLDNVIRIQHGLPPVHLEYSNETGTVTNTSKLSVAGNGTNSENHAPAGAVVGPVRTLLYGLNVAGEQDVADQVAITADPVMSKEVINAYMSGAAKITLLSSDSKPKEGTYYIVHEFHKKYYYLGSGMDKPSVQAREYFLSLFNEVEGIAQSEASRPSKGIDKLLNEQTLQRFNGLR